MKFTCDNCGAQYLIADTKLGDRGVKVRCKKCSYVIILRPPGWSGAKKEGEQTLQSTDLDPSPPAGAAPQSITAQAAAEQDAVAPSFPSANDLASELAATSSDMGLSQEFAALGFSDDASGRNASLNVGLDVDKVSLGTDSISPFSSESVGGSLDYVPAPSAPSLGLSQPAGDHASQRPEADATEVLPREAGLGASSPPVDAGGDSTRVDLLPSALRSEAPESAFDSGVFGDDGTELASDPRSNGALFRAEEETEGDAMDALRVTAREAVENTAEDALPSFSPPPGVEGGDLGASATDTLAALASEVDQAEEGPNASTGEINVALAGVEKNELAEMQSSLENELEGLSDSLDWDGNAGEDEAESAPLEALNALASDSEQAEEPGEYDGFAQARAEQEIGTAFEAMFGGSAEDQQVLGAGDSLPNNVETRVFDVEAMQKVEAEQEMAKPAAVKDETPEWYVAIEDNQVGPMTVRDVLERWEAGQLAADSLCWRQGMGDWQPIKLTAELRVHLGSMEDRERTVVTALDSNELEDSMAEDSPPQISIAPEPKPESSQPMAAASGGGYGGETAMEEPSWRPSAASALASLAAEELSSSSSAPAKQQDDVAVGAALPATSDALEKLLQGGSTKASEASQFGAAEKSESFVRPLPRRADTVSSIPLRDPVAERSRNGWVMPVSILGGAIVLAGALVAVFGGDDDDPPETTMAGVQQGQVAMVQKPAQPDPSEVAKAPPPEAPKKVEAPKEDAKPEDAKPEEVEEKKPEPKAEEPEAEDSEVEEPDRPRKKKTVKKKPKRRPRRRAERRETVSRAPPPPPPRRSRSEVDDLLAPADRRRPARRRATVEDDVPRQLDDSDILGVLRKNRKSIISCVKKQQTADGSVSGTMMVNLVITKSGRTTRITVSPSRFRSSVAGRCVSSAVKRWRFPKFTGPNMPIDFPVRIR